MEQERNGQQKYTIDVAYIFRCLWKNAWVILMCACISGMLSYMFIDTFYNNTTYTSRVRLAVVSRDNSTNQLSERGVSAAVEQCLKILNSNILKEQIHKKDVEHKLSGDYQAVGVPDTNLIVMQATADTAEGAFCLLKAALEEFPTLTSYFGFGYRIKTLEPVVADTIVINDAGIAAKALLTALFVAVAGVGLIVYICMITDVIHCKEQAEKILDTEILGVQHYVKKARKQKSILINDELIDVSYLEEIEKLATRIQEKFTGKDKKILMVSGMKENEGKSTIAANIALCLAKRGNRVLLMEGDLRRPAVYKIFEKEVDPDRQVSQCLEGKASLKECFYSEKVQGEISYLLQEKAVAQSDKLLESEGFEALLKELKQEMDYVIIDTPPIGIVRDAEIIAGHADASLLVIRQDYVKAETVNDAVDILDDTGTEILGAVMTMAKGSVLSPSDRGKYGRYGRYGSYYYGYGRNREKRRQR